MSNKALGDLTIHMPSCGAFAWDKAQHFYEKTENSATLQEIVVERKEGSNLTGIPITDQYLDNGKYH